MYFDIEMVKKGRTCSFCGEAIEKGKWLFVLNDWNEQRRFFLKKNLCLHCSSQLFNDEFILFLKKLVNGLVANKSNYEIARTK